MTTTIKELKSIVDGKNKNEMLEGLNEVKQAIEESRTADSMVVMIKLDGNYVRFSSSIGNTMELVAQLELLKYDVMRRMKKEDM
tara:strand:+ start:1209 stop:1460 length:252 start_codon:yes stop_codon:yes gene_type:complete